MSNELRDTIAQALADEFDLSLDEQVVESSRVDVTLQSAADAVLAALPTGGWELVQMPDTHKADLEILRAEVETLRAHVNVARLVVNQWRRVATGPIGEAFIREIDAALEPFFGESS